ncbi:hypothetical protein MRB53_000467 [Persea americana]|uniref:Uncharacterized protein n=1 Tax=Persea americana TaxID=3435 RepID=A0ACC2MPZ0_PERAE|nr:hypothetical protein MRB53_000467 [Persea americana]
MGILNTLRPESSVDMKDEVMYKRMQGKITSCGNVSATSFYMGLFLFNVVKRPRSCLVWKMSWVSGGKS